MKISFYLHAWQGVLMFLIGIVCVLASFFGYVLSGGGEELLRRALWNKVPSGKVGYQTLDVNWRTRRIVATDVKHEDFSWPKEKPVARLSNLVVPKLSVQLEGWPPRIESIVVEGVRGASIDLTEGFLQGGGLPERKASHDLPRIEFVDCDLKLKLGGTAPLALNGCSGELSRGADERLRGGFRLRELNGKPFEFTLETLGDGRWVVTGGTIQLDTRAALSTPKNPFASKLDPVGMLIKALFSGEMGAEGTLTSLHISVQPETQSRAFSCDGEIGYSNLTLKLPSGEDKASEALPFLLGMLLGAEKMDGASLWPRVDRIVAGEPGKRGRISFHMSDHTLDFCSDEGSGSALTGVREGKRLPALESLKGCVETDAASQLRRIVVRGFLGAQWSFEARVLRNEDRSRAYELLLEPRTGDAARLEFGVPLWRIEARLNDYLSVARRAPELALAEFEVEANTRGAPLLEWLPPGLKQIAGRFHAKGGYYAPPGDPQEGRILRIDEARLDDGARIVYGGPERRALGPDFRPFWEAVYAMFATDKPWMVLDLSAKGGADVWLDKNLQWTRIVLGQWTVLSGALAHEGALTAAPADLKLSGEFRRDPAKETKDGEFRLEGADWNAVLAGKWVHDGKTPPAGDFQYKEENVPLKLHPLRETLRALGAVKNERVQRTFTAGVRTEGVKVDAK